MKFTLKARLMSGFMAMALVVAAMGAVSLYNTRQVHQSLVATYEKDLVALDKSSVVLAQLHNLRVGAHRFVGAPDAAREAKVSATLQGDLGDFGSVVGALDATPLAKEGSISTADFRAKSETFMAVVREAMAMKKSQGMAEAAWKLERDGRDRFLEAEEAMVVLHDKIQAMAKSHFDAANAAAGAALWLTLGFLLAAIAAAVALGLLLTRSIMKPLNAVATAADQLAAGDLNPHLDLTRQDELGDMARTFDAMSRQLRQVIAQVRGAAGTVAAKADDIGASSDQMGKIAHAQRGQVQETSATIEEMAVSIQQVAGNAQNLAVNTEETSASIEEMVATTQQVAGNAASLKGVVDDAAASIEQMAATIRQVAGHVTEVNQAAVGAASMAQQGREAVASSVRGMGEIEQVFGKLSTVIEGLGQSSAQIGQIVKVIEDIASQTNLLALNASIEAARAGEHGKGFAVVANEVKALAHRSSQATQDIAGLIQGIQNEMAQAIANTQAGSLAVGEGANLARSAGDALQGIVGTVETVNRLLGQVSEATRSQVDAAQLLTGSVGQMRNLTQQVALASGEQAKSADQMRMAVTTMTQMTQQVSMATSEQRKGGETILEAVEHINRSAHEVNQASDVIAGRTADLQRQALDLLEAIAYFKDSSPGTLEVRVAAASPAAPLVAR